MKKLTLQSKQSFKDFLSVLKVMHQVGLEVLDWNDDLSWIEVQRFADGYRFGGDLDEVVEFVNNQIGHFNEQ